MGGRGEGQYEAETFSLSLIMGEVILVHWFTRSQLLDSSVKKLLPKTKRNGVYFHEYIQPGLISLGFIAGVLYLFPLCYTSS